MEVHLTVGWFNLGVHILSKNFEATSKLQGPERWYKACSITISTNIWRQCKKHKPQVTWHLGFVHLWIIFIPGLSKKSSLSMKSILMLEHHRERCGMPWGKVTVQQINRYETCGFCIWLITVKPPLNVQWFAVYLWLNFNYHDSKISIISNFPQFSVQIHCSPLPEQEKLLSTDSYMHLSKYSLKVSIKSQD
jgi:hypothetical protein